MNKYRVVFTYQSTTNKHLPEGAFLSGEGTYSFEQAVELSAPSGERAAVMALQEQRLPAFYQDGVAVYWDASLAGDDRWITVVDQNTLAWGDPDESFSICFETYHLCESASSDETT